MLMFSLQVKKQETIKRRAINNRVLIVFKNAECWLCAVVNLKVRSYIIDDIVPLMNSS